MVFTIEPMINAGKKEVRVMGDGWTVKTKDRSHSAQYEHQIVVTENGCEVMTIRDEEIAEGRISRVMVNVQNRDTTKPTSGGLFFTTLKINVHSNV